MVRKLSRKEKIRLLSALKEGQITFESLRVKKVYFLKHINKKEGIYDLNGKELNQFEYENFCKKLKSGSNNPIIWNEFKSY